MEIRAKLMISKCHFLWIFFFFLEQKGDIMMKTMDLRLETYVQTSALLFVSIYVFEQVIYLSVFLDLLNVKNDNLTSYNSQDSYVIVRKLLSI